jgi:hypothetical protein
VCVPVPSAVCCLLSAVFDARSSSSSSSSSEQQGVLIVAGGRDMFANAAITLSVLRTHLRSSVPVEIVHYGPKELPSPEILAYIASFNSSSSNGSMLAPVYITDALAAAPPEVAAPHHRKLPEGFKSFPAKVYALTHVTRFQQVSESAAVCCVCVFWGGALLSWQMGGQGRRRAAPGSKRSTLQ